MMHTDLGTGKHGPSWPDLRSDYLYDVYDVTGYNTIDATMWIPTGGAVGVAKRGPMDIDYSFAYYGRHWS